MGKMKDVFIERMNEYDREWQDYVWDDSEYIAYQQTPPCIDSKHPDYSTMKGAMKDNYVVHNGWLFGYYTSIPYDQPTRGEGYFLKQVSKY